MQVFWDALIWILFLQIFKLLPCQTCLANNTAREMSQRHHTLPCKVSVSYHGKLLTAQHETSLGLAVKHTSHQSTQNSSCDIWSHSSVPWSKRISPKPLRLCFSSHSCFQHFFLFLASFLAHAHIAHHAHIPVSLMHSPWLLHKSTYSQDPWKARGHLSFPSTPSLTLWDPNSRLWDMHCFYFIWPGEK